MKLAVRELTVLIIDHMFGHCLPNALRYATMNLPLDQHRVQKIPEIINHGIARNTGDAGFGVDLDFGNMSAVREGSRGKRGFLGFIKQIKPPGSAGHLGRVKHRWRQVRGVRSETSHRRMSPRRPVRLQEILRSP